MLTAPSSEDAFVELGEELGVAGVVDGDIDDGDARLDARQGASVRSPIAEMPFACVQDSARRGGNPPVAIGPHRSI